MPSVKCFALYAGLPPPSSGESLARLVITHTPGAAVLHTRLVCRVDAVKCTQMIAVCVAMHAN